MRFCNAVSGPPDQLSGGPKMPNTKNSSVATITISFQPRFLFMKNDFRLQNVGAGVPARALAPPEIENPKVHFVASSAVVTDATEPRLTSIRKLSGGTRKWMYS